MNAVKSSLAFVSSITSPGIGIPHLQLSSRLKGWRLAGYISCAAAIAWATGPVSQAATIDWSPPVSGSGGSTAWATGTNWTGNTAPANDLTTDVARFDKASYNFNPDAGTTSVSGIVIGDGTTAATLSLAGTNLTIGANGIVKLANSQAAGITSAITLGAAQSWVNNSTVTLAVNGNITGSSDITINGVSGGVVSLNPTTTNSGFTGNFNVIGGSLNINSTNATSAANVVAVGANGTLTTNNAASPATIAGLNDISGAGGTVAVHSLGTLSIAGSGSYSFSGNITSVSSLQINLTGGGSQTLSGVNTYAGSTTVNSGILNIRSDSALGSTAGGTTVASGGILQLQGGIHVGAEALTISQGAGVTGQNVALVNVSGNNTYAGLLTWNTGTSGIVTKISSDSGNLALTNTGTIAITGGRNAGLTGSGNGSIAGVLNGTGSQLTKSGSGTWTLTGNNTYTGTTTISVGRLQLGDGNSTGSLYASGGLVNNANLTINRNNAVAQGTDFSTSAITGTGSFTQAGTGTTTLNATNSFSGVTTVERGTLSFTSGNASATANQALGANATVNLGVASASSGTLNYTGAAGTLAKAVNVLGNGSDTIQNSGTGLLTLAGTITKNGTVLTLKGGSNGINVTGAIAGSGANSDLIVDGGNTTLSNANTYNGPTSIINGATLSANVTNALPTTNGRTAVYLDQTVAGAATGTGSSILVLGSNQSVSSLSGQGSSTVNLNTRTLTIGSASGAANFAGVISGANGALIKDNASTQTLSGNNTYTGSTTVSLGTLLINGNQTSATGTVGVSSTATLGGSGTTGGAVSVASGGILAPGNNTIGNLTVASLTLNSGAISNFEIGGTTGGAFDTITTTGGAGSITLNGTLNLTFSVSLANNTPIDLFVGPATNTGDFSAINLSGSGYSGNFTYQGGTLWKSTQGTQTLSFEASTGVLSAVPEPATWALLAFSLTTVMVLRRRRQN